ncbi:MAG: hypothetical protein E6Q97_02330 [Desulfurellales bacterium]|nr:MAG: hypothetical protein E6Q97_02330 [Desulfurellales bacterium]
MANGIADHASLEVSAATIAAGSSAVWTSVGSLPNCLALMVFNDLDAGGVELYFSEKQGATGPAGSVAAHVILAAGEPFFVNYKSVGHIFGSCDVYVRSRTAEPTAGSLRFVGVKVAPRKFKE